MKIKAFIVWQTMKNLRLVIILFAIGHATQASATPEELRQRVQADLKGECLELFLSDKWTIGSLGGYQYYADSLLDQVVFAVGEFNSKQYCSYARRSPLTTWENAENKALASCEKLGAKCEVYAHNNDIVYVNIHEKLKMAENLLDSGNVSAANRAIQEVSKKGITTLTFSEKGVYEYLLGKILIASNTEQDRVLAIEHFNNAWFKYNNVNGAIEEGNLLLAAGDIENKWKSIHEAYMYFLAKASDAQKKAHPEVEKNWKQQIEPYYQANLIRQKAAIEAAANEQAEADVMAKREAEQREKQEQLDAKKLAQYEKQREKIRLAEEKRLAKEGDGSADDRTCKSYGARPGSDGYIKCRIQLSSARQIADEQQAAQKANDAAAAAQKLASDAALLKAQNLAEFTRFKKCAEETNDPGCINNAGTYAQRLGNMGDARDWWTLAARHGAPVAIKNLTNNGFPVPEPDLLRQKQQAKNSDSAAAALLLLLGGVNAYQQGKAAGYQSQPVPAYQPPVDCTTTGYGNTVRTRCQ